MNAALRSSLKVLTDNPGCRVKARVSGAQREPGQMIMSEMFLFRQMKAIWFMEANDTLRQAG
jgi:hypothetical protein